MTPGSVRLAATALMLVAAACGADATAPGPVPADALPGQAGAALELDATSLARDATDPDELETILENAGFAGGTQRTFSQTEDARPQRSLARLLSFEDVAGARAYLEWLSGHLDEVIGTAKILDPAGVPGAFLALGEPECLCTKATPVFLVAWAKGSTVLTLEVGGKGVRSAEVRKLAAAFDEAIAA